MQKYYKIIYNIFRSFSLPIFSFTLSIIGIRFFGKLNWGEFIYVFTLINFFAFLGNFGNKDFLLRKYSNNPSKIIDYFTISFSSRILLLLLLFSISMLFILPTKTALISFILILLIYTYQSFDSLVIFHQKFLQQLIAECLGFTIIIAWFFYNFNFDLSNLLFAYIVSYTFKIVILGIVFRKEIQFLTFNISIDELKKSFPSFLIIFSGFLASKIDLYIVNFKLSSDKIAEYQLGITAFLLLQSLSYLIILPFNKHIYRLKPISIQKIKNKLAYISIPLIVLGSFFIWILLEHIAKINLLTEFYVLGAFASIPNFFYILDVLLLYKNKKENIILKISLVGSFMNLVLSYNLIEFYGILGAITSVLITQYIVLIFYKLNFIK
jgi:O-antigen/teichoic acid export membrane protein